MQCVYCEGVFTETTNVKSLLACGHSCCVSCLKNFVDQEKSMFSCPTCFLQFSMSQLESSVHRFITPPSKLEEIGSPKCSLCEDDHPATKKCLDCDDMMCESMSIGHLRSKVSNHHKVVPLTDPSLSKIRKSMSALHPKSCVKHNKPFDFLDPENESFNRLLCFSCGKSNITPLSESFSSQALEKVQHIRELAPQLSSRLEELQEEECVLEGRLGKLRESKERVVGEVRRSFQALREALERREGELLLEVDELFKSSSFELEDGRDRASVWQGQLGVLSQCVEEMEEWVSSSSSSSGVDSDSRSVFFEKGLMVDVCLLEDAIRSALSLSDSSVLSGKKLWEMGDQIDFQLSVPRNFSGSVPDLSLSLNPLLPFPPFSSSNSSTSPASDFGILRVPEFSGWLSKIGSLSISSFVTPPPSLPPSQSLFPTPLLPPLPLTLELLSASATSGSDPLSNLLDSNPNSCWMSATHSPSPQSPFWIEVTLPSDSPQQLPPFNLQILLKKVRYLDRCPVQLTISEGGDSFSNIIKTIGLPNPNTYKDNPQGVWTDIISQDEMRGIKSIRINIVKNFGLGAYCTEVSKLRLEYEK